MTPQTAPAQKPDADPITPVIVKTGGDTGDPQMPGTPNNVTINSSSIPFAETVPGPKWSSSQSTLTGRITNLSITDGSITTEVPVTPGPQLASVSLKFGPAQLIAMESGIPEHNKVLLLLTSPEVPFNVIQDGDWTTSSTTFPNKIKSMTLMVGDQQQLFYEFQTDDVTVQISFK
jgi:hypothetical protein